jgi:hypothetical protein
MVAHTHLLIPVIIGGFEDLGERIIAGLGIESEAEIEIEIEKNPL